MSAEDDGPEKEHDPTPEKLQKAREKGEIVRSADVNMMAAFAGFVLVLILFGGPALFAMGQTLKVVLDQSDVQSTLMFNSASAPAGGLLSASLIPLLPLFLGPAVAVLLAVLLQRSLVFAPAKIAPQWSRISPMATAKQKFGSDGLFEFAKSSVKLGVVSVVLAFFLWDRQGQILGTLYLSPAMAMAVLGRLIIDFLLIVVGIAAITAGLDYAWQYRQHHQRHRMTRQEVIDEHKQQDGDPHARAARRQRGMDLASNQMLADVPKADVVIVNPTHFAVALKWDRKANRAPVCVAKGVDEIAARIRERAVEAGVPLHSDPPAARALHAAVEIGQEIGPDHYRAVAAAIRFSEAMRKRARRGVR